MTIKIKFGSLKYGDKCLYKYDDKIYVCFKGKAVIDDTNWVDGLFTIERSHYYAFTFLPLKPNAQVYHLPDGVKYDDKFGDLAVGDSFIRHSSDDCFIKMEELQDYEGFKWNCLGSSGQASRVFDYEMVFKIDPKEVF